VRKPLLVVMAIALVFTSCDRSDDAGTDSGGGGGDGSGTSATVEPPIPLGDARCEEIQAAVDYFDQEFVFRAEVDNILSGIVVSPEDAPPNIHRFEVLAVRDQWSLCAIDAPPYAEEVAANSSLSYDSPRASAVRASLKSQDIHAFDKGTDSAIDFLGARTCIAARALQPLSTTEIEQIAVGLIDRYGRMDTVEAGKVFYIIMSAYCPDVDLIGGS
jgi:hypothetical protein